MERHTRSDRVERRARPVLRDRDGIEDAVVDARRIITFVTTGARDLPLGNVDAVTRAPFDASSRAKYPSPQPRSRTVRPHTSPQAARNPGPWTTVR